MPRARAAASSKTIACPACGATYRVAGTMRGQVRCKSCKNVFQVSRHGDAARKDNQTAIKASIAVVVVGVLFALIFAFSGGEPVTPPKKTDTRGFSGGSSGSRRADIDRIRRERELAASNQPALMAKAFMKAMADGDEATIEKLFAFDLYFAAAADKYRWPAEERYENRTPEMQKEMRDEQIDAMLHEETCQWLGRALLPALQAGDKSMDAGQRVSPRGAYFEYQIKDSKNSPVVNFLIELKLKDGLDPATDGNRYDAWQVSKVATQWHTIAEGVAKKDKRKLDMGIERRRRQERDMRIKAGGGPVEADPFPVKELAGTSESQKATIASLITTAFDPSLTREANDAKFKLAEMGWPAIPQLLNTLIGKDHRDGEADIIVCVQATDLLKEISGKSFGYGPPTKGASAMGMGLAGATPEQREQAVRRWFGWWKTSGRTAGGKQLAPDPEEEALKKKKKKRRGGL